VAEGNIFVSYRRSDAGGFAFSLHERLLEEFGPERVFMDVDTIVPGTDFAPAIRENLERSDVLLAVIGRDWLQAGASGSRRIDDAADWVRIEVATALERKIPVIPVLVGGASLPRAGELPEPLKELSRRQSVDVRNASFRDDTDRLLEAIDRALSGAPEPPPRRPWHAFTLLALVTCFMVVAAWTGLFNAAGVDDALDALLLARFETFNPPATSPSLVVVTASNRPGENGSLDEPPGPGWRRYHAGLIEALSAAGARVIAFDVLFEGATSGTDELARAIFHAARRGTTVVLASDGVEFQGGRAVPVMADALADTPWGLVSGSPGRGHMPLARRGPDAWSRIRPEPLVPSLALQAVAQFRRTAERASAVVPTLGAGGDTIELRTEQGRVVEEIPVWDRHLSIPLGDGEDSLKPFPFHQVYESRAHPAALDFFKDSLVLVGIEDDDDFHANSTDGTKHYGVAYHALVINQLLERRCVRRPEPPAQIALIVLMAALAWLLRSDAHPLFRHRLRLKVPRRGERAVTVSTGLVVSTLLYLLGALLAFRWFAVLLRVGYDVPTLWAAYAAIGIARRRAGLIRVPVATSVLARASVVAILAFAAPALSPAVARADSAPLAQVVKIVVDGSVKDEATTTEARVIRAEEGTVVPAAATQLLLAGDELDTGTGVSVEILYLAEAVEQDKTVIVGPASRVVIEDPTSLRVILGRILSNVRGYFQVPSGDAVLAVRGTEFEVQVAADGQTRLLVLQGVVAAGGRPSAPGAEGTAPEAAVNRMEEITLVPGRRAEARPTPTSEASVRDVLHWTSEPIAAGRPAFGVPRTPAPVPRAARPADVLEEARFRAIVRNDPEAFASLGRTYVAWGEGAKAVDALQKAARANPALVRSPRVLTDVGSAYRLKGDLDSAEPAIRRALALDPRFGPAHNALGNVYLDRAEIAKEGEDRAGESRNLDEAERAFDAALEKSTDDPLARAVALTNRGQVLVRKGDVALETGDSAAARRRFDQARESFDAAQRARPDFAYSRTGLGDASRGLARAAARQGDADLERRLYRQAEAAYGTALATDPRSAPALMGLGTVYQDTGRTAEAQDTYRRGVAARPRDASAQYQLGRLESELGERGAAQRMEAYLSVEKPRLREGVSGRQAREVVEARPRREAAPRATPEPTPTAAATPPPRRTPPPTPPPLTRVPDLDRVGAREALARIESSGLRAYVVEEPSCDRVGQVLGTDPPSGRALAPGSVVKVVVGSPGRSPAVVPSLRGKPAKQAEAALRSQGLQARVQTRQSGRARPGTVLDQRPEPQSRIAKGCVVELLVEADERRAPAPIDRAAPYRTETPFRRGISPRRESPER
jgi:tetratricopeptide (TPR) repeat protein/CHASE2 domain-containing sensor protein